MAQLSFQGLETRTTKSSDESTSTSQNPSHQIPAQLAVLNPANVPAAQEPDLQHEDVFVVMEARMIFSPPPKALTIIKENIDRDIAFHQTSGAFALRLRSRVGDSVVPSLIERVVHIQRLVNFIQILQTRERLVHCENISLGRITFTYGKIPGKAYGDAVDIDGDRLREYTAVVDFSAADNMMTLILERGNPHLAIIDHLTRILNGKEGLDGVAQLLPLTLPVLQGLNALEGAWASVSKGQAFVNIRAADSYIIRYDLFPSSSVGTTSVPKTQKIIFELRLRQRRGVPWWYIKRTGVGEGGDNVDVALKRVWNTIGQGWQGMRVSGVAQANGIEELLGKVDQTLRDFVTNDKGNEALVATSAPSRPKISMPPQRQQPTPNQSQSQGRDRPMKTEIVEID